MKKINITKFILVAGMLICMLLFAACTPAAPVETPTPTPAATPAPTPEPQKPTVTPEPTPVPDEPIEGGDAPDGTGIEQSDSNEWRSRLAAAEFDESGEHILLESIMPLSGSDLVYGFTETGREVIVHRNYDYSEEWWNLVAENSEEYGWQAGPDGAGVDMYTADVLTHSLMMNSWVIPAGGYTFDMESVAFLGGGMCYAEAHHEDGFSNMMQLLVAFSYAEGDEDAGWFPLAYSTGGAWSLVEG